MLRIIFIILIGIFLVVFGCSRQDGYNVLARVGNRIISLKEVNDRIAKLPSYYQTLVANNRKKFLDDLIVEELFYEEAVRDGLHREKETQDVIKEAKKKILIARLIKKEVEDRIVIDADAARGYYEDHKDEFRTHDMYRASHILLADQQEAEAALREINSASGNFEETARAKTLDATSSRGGDIGFFARGQLVPEFEALCLKMNVGDPCRIVKTQFGYHIVKLTDKRPSSTEEFEKVRGPIEDRLKREKRKELFNKLVSGLKEKYKVRIEEEVYKLLDEEPKSDAE